MTITTRLAKGSELTHTEMDTNFTDLRDGVAILAPKTKGTGIKIDPAAPAFGWHDLVGELKVYGDSADALRQVYRGGIKALQFIATTTDSAYVDFHMPHDYVPNTEIFIHVHWSHTSATVTGGSCTWVFETIYAKGHNQAAFAAPILISVVQAASTTPYQHMIAETVASVGGGSAVLLDTADLEVDGVFQVRVYLDSNDMTDSVTVPNPFVHFVDIHYQSTGLPTKGKAPDFWA